MNSTAAAVFRLKNAAFGYNGKISLSGVTAELYPGQAVALIGPNGSGKSTLLGGLVGLTEILGGEVSVLGKTPAKARSRVGLLPQRDSRNLELPVTVKQVVTMGLYKSLGFRPLGRKHQQKVTAALAQVGLENLINTLFSELSGGQQQRVILARALVSDPQLLLLDEPFNGLDHPNRKALLATINSLRARGCAIAVSTHDLEIAKAACSHVCLLDHRMIAFGELASTLTLENVATTFHDTTVEIDSHMLTTRHEAAGHSHHSHASPVAVGDCSELS